MYIKVERIMGLKEGGIRTLSDLSSWVTAASASVLLDVEGSFACIPESATLAFHKIHKPIPSRICNCPAECETKFEFRSVESRQVGDVARVGIILTTTSAESVGFVMALAEAGCSLRCSNSSVLCPSPSRGSRERAKVVAIQGRSGGLRTHLGLGTG